MKQSLKLDERRIKILIHSLETGGFGKGDYPIIRDLVAELEKLQEKVNA